MHAVVSIAGNDLRLLLRDRTAFFFTVIFPVLFGLGFGFIFQATMGGGGDAVVRVAVVDLDGSDMSAAFVGGLDGAADLEIVALDDEDAASAEVRAGAYAAAVVVPSGFGDGLEGVFAGEPLKIRGVVDPSRQAETAMVQGMVQAAAFQALAAGFTDPDRVLPMLEEARAALAEVEGGNVMQRALMRQAIASAEAVLRGEAVDDNDDTGNDGEDPGGAGFTFNPVEVSLESAARTETGPRLDSAFQITFPQGAAWGLVGCVTGFGLALVAERNRGTLMRLRTASIRGVDVLLGKAVACFVTALFVLTLTLAVFIPFGVTVPSPMKLAVVFVATAWAFVGLMALLATATRSEQGAEGFVRAVLLVMALVGGAGVPKFFLEQVHPWLPYVSPIGWAIAGLEGATWRQLSWGQLATPLAVLVLIGTGCFGAGLALFGRWKHQ